MPADCIATVAVAIRMLGPFNALGLDGRPVMRPGRRSIALMACLAVDQETVWTRDRLAGLLWGSRPKEQARASLRQEFVRLRQALGQNPIAFDDGGSFRLRDDDIDIDVVQFQSALANPSRLADAAALYRGDLLEEIDCDRDFEVFGEWLATHRRRLKNAAVGCLMQLLRGAIACGDDAESTRLAERAVKIEPTYEEAHQWLIRAHAARHDLHAVMEQFRSCREALRARQYIEPSPETCKLVEQIKMTLRIGPMERLPSPASTGQCAQPIAGDFTIAVLPFVDLSVGERDEALVDGLTEETITALTRIPDVSVAARSSVMSYKGVAMDVRQITAELGVKYALEASIRRDRKQLRANLRLIDGRTGLHLWAESFHTPLSDLMSVRDDFIRQSVIRLHIRLQLAISGAKQRPAQE